MNYARSNNVSGSESSDSEHNEGKKDGNACENVDNIYRDTNGNIVDHDWKLLPPIPNEIRDMDPLTNLFDGNDF